jgi:endonuclease/exonuclease/phosphatase family metal-dependent hydrolase
MMVDSLRTLAPDVVFLQEVLQKEGLPNQARQLADSLGHAFVFTSVDPEDGPKRYGNAILTPHAILATHEIMLPPRDDYRVAAHARLAIDGRLVDAYVTHLHHTRGGGAIRAEQIDGLIAFIDSTRGYGALLLGGDFNADPAWPEMAPLRARWTDAFAAVHPSATGDTVTTLNPAHGHAPVRIDHLFVDPQWLRPLAAMVIMTTPTPAGVWASDHFGLWARFAWTR